MRKTLNENPVAQAVMIGVLAIIVGYLMLTRVMGGHEPAATTEATTTPATEAPVAAVPADPAAAGTEPSTVAPATEPAETSAPSEDAFVPGPGLPKPVVVAFAKGETVALLITKRAGLDDAELRGLTRSFESIKGVTVFTTNVHNVADYSRITAGVDLNRAPAIVMLSPRDVHDGIPVATVAYGYRGVESAHQAIADARYKGPELPYYPK